MKDIDSPLAGEMSGHIFIADKYFGYDDALYAAARLIKLLAASNKSLHEMLNELPHTYITPEIRIDCEDDRKFDVIDSIKKRLKKSRKKFVNIDGIRFDFKTGWWLLRASNTQPALVCRIESTCKEDVEKEFMVIRDLLAEEFVRLPVSDLVID